MELEDALRVTDKLTREVIYRSTATNERISYYRGETGILKYSSEEFGKYFAKRFSGFADNWCAPVVQATAERMNYNGFRLFGQTKGADKELSRIWEANDCERGSSEAFLDLLVTGRAYVMVAPSSDPNTPKITWISPTKAIVDVDPMTGIRRYFLVVVEDDGIDYATLYTPDLIWKFKRVTSQERYMLFGPDGRPMSQAMTHSGWTPLEVDGEDFPAVNVMGVVPGVEIQNQTMLDGSPISDIQGIMAMQDSINLVWGYLLNALDFASLPQRVVTGADMPMIAVLDKDGQPTGDKRPVELDKLTGERVLWIPDEMAKIAEWSPANLNAFGAVIDKAVEHIAAQTRTPPHYLVAKMVNTAAESLNVAEAGLVSKVKERIRYVNPGLKEVNRLVAIAKGDDDKRIAAIAGGTALWENVQYRSEAQMADAMLKLKGVGFPFEFLAERYGLSPEDISRVMDMRDAELARDPLAVIQNAMQAPLPIGG